MSEALVGTAFKIHARTKEGFEVEFSGPFAEWDSARVYVTDPDFGFAPTKLAQMNYGGPVDRIAGPVDLHVTAPGSSNGPICQFCGNVLRDIPTYTADQLAASRSKKMGQMGERALPVCGKCWNTGGWKAKAEALYQARQQVQF